MKDDLKLKKNSENAAKNIVENAAKNTSENKSLIEFPCAFTIKIMGLQQDGFIPTIEKLIQMHVQNFGREQIKTRPSSKGKYLAITAEVYVYNQNQLDDIYRALSAHPMVIMVL